MTTFWARMIIFNEYKHGNLPKKAAEQFDELLERCEYISQQTGDIIDANTGKKTVRLTRLNGYDTRCVLGNIGAVKKSANSNVYKFDVIKYIKETTIDTVINEGCKRRDILANLLQCEFLGLDYEIEDGLRNDIYSKEDLLLIKQYLTDTYPIAEADVSRSSKQLIEKIVFKLIDINNEKAYNNMVNKIIDAQSK